MGRARRHLLPSVLAILLIPTAATAVPPSASDAPRPKGPCLPARLSEPIAAQGGVTPPEWSPGAGSGLTASPPASGAGDYRDRISTTPLGWPRLDRWCVWVEPLSSAGPQTPWEQRWLEAVDHALTQWQALLPLVRVNDPAAAQIRILRRRPPLRQGASGRMVASNGRATLELRRVLRGDRSFLEPSVEVLLSPGQRQQAIEAAALHELGHAVGLWGHSDQPGDAMAAIPGASPVLTLSERDRATLRWLYAQPTRFGIPLPP
jgi:predicted Zn-dependent protease